MHKCLSAHTHTYSRFVGVSFLFVLFIAQSHLILKNSVPISRTAGHM